DALGDMDQLRGREAELGVVSTRRLPLPRAAGMELEAHAQERLYPHLAADAQHPLQFSSLLEGYHDLAAELAAPQGEADEVVVLETVAAQQCVVVGVVCQAQRQFGLAAGLEAGTVLGAVTRYGLEHDA